MEHKELYEKLDNHENRITKIETKEEVAAVRFDNLCSQMGGVTKVLWFLSTTIFLTLIGFFIWYVQSLPRG